MKKMFKVLLFIVSIFTIFSVSAMADKMTLVEDENQRFFSGVTMFHFKKVKDNDSAYAFCLDSNEYFYGGASYNKSNSIKGIDSAKVRNVIFKAYADGLGTEHNIYGLSNKDFYGVAQMAVWYAAHGTNKGGMHSNTYKKWIADSKARTKAYDALIAASDPVIPSYDFKVESDKNVMTVTSNRKYYESNSYKIVGSSNLKYTVTGDKGACILYNGECEKTQVLNAGDEFKLRIAYVPNVEVSASATIKSSNYLKGYDFALYTPGEKKDKVQQNAAAFIPEFDSLEKTVKASGKEERVIKLNVKKTDITGSKELGGAKLVIKDSKGNEFISWTSEEGKIKEITGLKAGEIYNITETAAPKGYKPIYNSIYFMVDMYSHVTVCNITDDSKDKTNCGSDKKEDVLVIKNETTKLNVSKTDITGSKELGGAKLVIKDSKGGEFTSWTSEEGKTHIVEGLTIGEIYELVETIAPEGYQVLTNSIKFVLNDNGSVTVCDIVKDSKGNDSCKAMSTADKLTIKNDVVKTTKVVISKKDLSSKNELPGASMKLTDINGKEIASWISGDKPYEIEGLPAGKYILSETLPADKYKVGMIIKGQPYSEYKFELKEGEETRIEVFNEIITDVPKTGVSANMIYAIGGLALLFGIGTIVVIKRKETM